MSHHPTQQTDRPSVQATAPAEAVTPAVQSLASTEQSAPPHATLINGELHIDGVVVCPFCLEDQGSPWCGHEAEASFAQAWAAFLAAVAPTQTVGWSR